MIVFGSQSLGKTLPKDERLLASEGGTRCLIRATVVVEG